MTRNGTNVAITFPPTNVVRLDDETRRRDREEGMRLQRDIERNSASMFAPSPSEAAKLVR